MEQMMACLLADITNQKEIRNSHERIKVKSGDEIKNIQEKRDSSNK
jgi:hypothetical protein